MLRDVIQFLQIHRDMNGQLCFSLNLTDTKGLKKPGQSISRGESPDKRSSSLEPNLTSPHLTYLNLTLTQQRFDSGNWLQQRQKCEWKCPTTFTKVGRLTNKISSLFCREKGLAALVSELEEHSEMTIYVDTLQPFER